MDKIIVKGARVNNLKNIDIELVVEKVVLLLIRFMQKDKDVM